MYAVIIVEVSMKGLNVMRKFWVFAVLLMFVFAFSGCGGGSLDPETSHSEPSVPNDLPDTYDTQKVLAGSWRAIDSEYEFSTDSYFGFRLNSALLVFDSVDIKGTVAQAKVSSRQEWFTAYTSSDLTVDLGVQNIGLDFDSRTGTMIHQGKDRWRCNVDGDSKILMNITVSSDTVIKVNYQGVTGVLYDNTVAEYDFTLNFRKETYTR